MYKVIVKAALSVAILVLITIVGSYIINRNPPPQNINITKKLTPATAKKVFNAKSYMLDNGLKIVVVENHRAPVITHMIWYKVGAADEPRGKSGIAHFLEHLMFKGQSHPTLGDLEEGEFSRIIRSLGGEGNAFTSQDYTAYFQSISSKHLEKVMSMEAGRMTGMNIPAEGFAAENKVIMEERRQRTDNDPRAQMAEQMMQSLFPNHPYAMPVIGWMHEIEDLSHDEVMSFYHQYYAPNNAVLVVSGDVDGAQVYEIAKRTYGLIPPSDNLPERKRTISPPFIAATTMKLEHEIIKEPILRRVYRAPSARQDKDTSLALEVLEDILGNGSTSRLYKSLVIEQKIATNISLSYRSTAWDDARISISATPQAGIEITQLQDAINDELRKVITEGISDDELSDSITRLQAEAIYALDSLSGPAMIIGSSLTTGLTLDDIEYWPQQIEAVSKEQIQEAATLYLNPDEPSKTPPIEGILMPKAVSDEVVE